MGVPVEVWRMRIGSHLCGPKLRQSVEEKHCSVMTMVSLSHFLVLLILLVIGNVEVNPGPATYKCHVCHFADSSIQSVAGHQQLHGHEKNFLFSCPHSLCQNKFKTFKGLISHLNDIHKTMKGIESGNQTKEGSALAIIPCQVPNCGTTVSAVSALCRHYLNDHISNKKDAVKCPLVKKCLSSVSFTVRQNLASHLSIYHSGWKDDKMPLQEVVSGHSIEPSSIASSSGSNFEDINMDWSQTGNLEMDWSDTDEAEVQPAFSFADLFFRHIGKFYLKLKADCVLPERTIQTISEGLQVFSDLIQFQTKSSLRQALQDLKLSEDQLVSVTNQVCLSDVFFAAHHKEEPGPTFTTSTLRQNYIDENFKYIPPTTVHLDEDRIDGETVQLIRPRATLELILQDKSIQKQIQESFHHQGTTGIYKDYTDGKVFQERPTSKEERIDLILSSDAYTIPSHMKGASKKKYKLNATYFTIGNLKPHTRSKLDSIHLALLVRDDLLSDRDNYGPSVCYKPLLDDLKELERNGIDFMGRNVKVRIQFVVCDSLGAHQAGGLTESFSGEYFCRFCETTRTSFHKNPSKLLPFRTKQDYHGAIASLKQLRKTNNKIATFKGVKENSVFNELQEFHVTDPGFPPCVAHDVFEGVVDYDLTDIISNLVKAGWFSYEALNRSIQNFPFTGSDADNRPSPAITEEKLNGHAVQIWTLCRLLPLILEGKIKDTQNKYWQLYLKLKKIVSYACCSSFSEDDITIFDSLLQEYMMERKVVLEKAPKPKHHFLRHYAALVRLLGPIIHLFTLRFEAKHQFFKRIAHACRNFINLPATLAQRHQIYLSYLSSGVLFPEGVGPTKEHKFNASDFGDEFNSALEDLGTISTTFSSLEYDGVMYKPMTYILFDTTQEIGLVKLITRSHTGIHLIVEKYNVEHWEEYGLYRLKSDCHPPTISTVAISSLSHPIAQPVYEFQEKLCFVPKHVILL